MGLNRNGISRRDFMGRMACGAGGVLLGGQLCGCNGLGSARRGGKMRPGLVTYLWGKDWDLETLITNCEKAGMLGVELRTTHKHGVEPTLNGQQRREVKKRFADSAVTLVGLGPNSRFDSPDPQKLDQSIASAKEFVKLSYDVGGSGVKVQPNDFQKDVPHEQTIEQIGKSLNTLGAFAADYGQQIRLEVHGQCQNLPVIKSIMDVADHWNVRVCWNSNMADLEGGGLEYNFNLVKDRLGDTAHVRELNAGDYPYQQLINLFAGMDYPSWILLEASTEPADRVEAMKEQVKIFKQLCLGAVNS